MSDFPTKLWWYAGGLVVAAVTSAALLLRDEPAPDLTALVLLGALVVFCSHRDVRLPTGTFLSPGFMVCIAAVVVFASEDALSGVVLVGMASGIYLRGLSRRTWGWIPFNAGVTGLALFAAGATYLALPPSLVDDLPAAVLGAAVCGLVYSISAWMLVAVSFVIEGRGLRRELIDELGQLVAQSLPFAVVGFFLGRLYVDLGPTVMLLIVVPILIAREMFASYLKVKESHDETVRMLVGALEAKDRYTAGHAERVASYAQYMGEQMGFGSARLERLRFAALMHDIGKLVIPNHLLNKPGRLTEEEFARIRLHEKVSVQMLSHIDFLRPIAGASHSDHTRFDPDDPGHPIEPYIVNIADAYDSMTSTRAYRKALPQDVAFEELRSQAGLQFHPQCVEALVVAIEARGEKHGAGFERRIHFADAPEVGLGSAGLGDLLSFEG